MAGIGFEVSRQDFISAACVECGLDIKEGVDLVVSIDRRLSITMNFHAQCLVKSTDLFSRQRKRLEKGELL